MTPKTFEGPTVVFKSLDVKSQMVLACPKAPLTRVSDRLCCCCIFCTISKLDFLASTGGSDRIVSKLVINRLTGMDSFFPTMGVRVFCVEGLAVGE